MKDKFLHLQTEKEMYAGMQIENFQSQVCVCTASTNQCTDMRKAPAMPGHKSRAEMERDMVKHVILWKLKDNLTTEEKMHVKAAIKEGLEGLRGQIPGLVDINVRTEGLASSNADLMLDSSFVDEESLKGYSVHPAHVQVADTKVRPYTEIRLCLDYEE